MDVLAETSGVMSLPGFMSAAVHVGCGLLLLCLNRSFNQQKAGFPVPWVAVGAGVALVAGLFLLVVHVNAFDIFPTDAQVGAQKIQNRWQCQDLMKDGMADEAYAVLRRKSLSRGPVPNNMGALLITGFFALMKNFGVMIVALPYSPLLFKLSSIDPATRRLALPVVNVTWAVSLTAWSVHNTLVRDICTDRCVLTSGVWFTYVIATVVWIYAVIFTFANDRRGNVFTTMALSFLVYQFFALAVLRRTQQWFTDGMEAEHGLLLALWFLPVVCLVGMLVASVSHERPLWQESAVAESRHYEEERAARQYERITATMRWVVYTVVCVAILGSVHECYKMKLAADATREAAIARGPPAGCQEYARGLADLVGSIDLMFRGNDVCVNYQADLHRSSWAAISIPLAFTRMVVSTFIDPLDIVGKGLGTVGKGLGSIVSEFLWALPLFYQPFAFAGMLAVVLIMSVGSLRLRVFGWGWGVHLGRNEQGPRLGATESTTIEHMAVEDTDTTGRIGPEVHTPADERAPSLPSSQEEIPNATNETRIEDVIDERVVERVPSVSVVRNRNVGNMPAVVE